MLVLLRWHLHTWLLLLLLGVHARGVHERRPHLSAARVDACVVDVGIPCVLYQMSLAGILNRLMRYWELTQSMLLPRSPPCAPPPVMNEKGLGAFGIPFAAPSMV